MVMSVSPAITMPPVTIMAVIVAMSPVIRMVFCMTAALVVMVIVISPVPPRMPFVMVWVMRVSIIAVVTAIPYR